MILKTFIEYSNDMNDIFKNIGKYSPNTKRKILIVFDDRLLVCLVTKNFKPVVTGLFY